MGDNSREKGANFIGANVGTNYGNTYGFGGNQVQGDFIVNLSGGSNEPAPKQQHTAGRSTYTLPGGGMQTSCPVCEGIWTRNNSMANYQALQRGDHIYVNVPGGTNEPAPQPQAYLPEPPPQPQHTAGRSTCTQPSRGMQVICPVCKGIWTRNNSMANYQALLRGDHIYS